MAVFSDSAKEYSSEASPAAARGILAKASDEERWVDEMLARKKGIGFLL
jgi:hypothetical protein